jgi:hypothetical protein
VDHRLVDLGDSGAVDPHHADQLAGDLAVGVLRGEHESRAEPEVETFHQTGADIGCEPVVGLEVTAFDQLVVQDRELRFCDRIDAGYLGRARAGRRAGQPDDGELWYYGQGVLCDARAAHRRLGCAARRGYEPIVDLTALLEVGRLDGDVAAAHAGARSDPVLVAAVPYRQ